MAIVTNCCCCAQASNTSISLITGCHIGVFLSSGVFAGFLCDRFGYRRTIFLSSTLSVCGFAGGFFCEQLSHLFVSVGCIAALGGGIAHVGVFAIIGFYFDRKRQLAGLLLMCAPGLSIVVIAPLTEYLIERYTWNGALLIIGALQLNMLPAAMLLRDPIRSDSIPDVVQEPELLKRSPSKPEGRTPLRLLLRDSAFWLFMVHSFFMGAFSIVPLSSVRFLVAERNWERVAAASVLSVASLCNVGGRIVLAAVSAWTVTQKRVNHFIVFHTASLLLAVTIVFIPMMHDHMMYYIGFGVISLFWGLKFGVYPGLM